MHHPFQPRDDMLSYHRGHNGVRWLINTNCPCIKLLCPCYWLASFEVPHSSYGHNFCWLFKEGGKKTSCKHFFKTIFRNRLGYLVWMWIIAVEGKSPGLWHQPTLSMWKMRSSSQTFSKHLSNVSTKTCNNRSNQSQVTTATIVHMDTYHTWFPMMTCCNTAGKQKPQHTQKI